MVGALIPFIGPRGCRTRWGGLIAIKPGDDLCRLLGPGDSATGADRAGYVSDQPGSTRATSVQLGRLAKLTFERAAAIT